MELSLFSLTAILLLLSGAGGRVCLDELPALPASLVRLWLARDEDRVVTPELKQRLPGSRQLPAGLASLTLGPRHGTNRRVSLRLRRLRLRLQGGRFPAGSVVFAAMAPPSR